VRGWGSFIDGLGSRKRWLCVLKLALALVDGWWCCGGGEDISEKLKGTSAGEILASNESFLRIWGMLRLRNYEI